MIDCGPVHELEESKEAKASRGGSGGCISDSECNKEDRGHIGGEMQSMTAASLTVFQNCIEDVDGVVSQDHAETKINILV